ncbi:Hypothetical predicted protein [Cloeon dipterum]|uniref:CHK kinase-like domain-containing protein n=1 Tax=Cloeon dipterum TaxID=197152 RepID=A0A8S1BZ09_9INSE|nr:Hypothetical predicted protein [Cloeon dipterum]
MLDETNLHSLVDAGQILAALRTKHGDERVRQLEELQVGMATENVLGITSLILRAKVAYVDAEGRIASDSLVVKRLPLSLKQLELVDNCNSFEREIEFLAEYAPLLRERALGRWLPLVECYWGAERTLVMEDLCAGGYQSLVGTIGDLRTDVFTPEHVEAVLKVLAGLHAASAGIDWEQRFPRYLPHNPLFDGTDGEYFRSTLVSAIEGLLFLADARLTELYPEVMCWLREGDVFEELRRCGKRDEQTGQLEVKIVDYQLGKFAPASCDLFYFLYTSISHDLRLANEPGWLELYRREFNALVGEQFRLEEQRFEQHCRKNRIYGLMFATLCRPMLYMHKRTPSAEMSDEKFVEFMVRDYKGHEHNQSLKLEVDNIFVDLVCYYYSNKFGNAQ